MGEAWSDWYAKDLVVQENPGIDTAADGEVNMGAYVDTGRQIRTQADRLQRRLDRHGLPPRGATRTPTSAGSTPPLSPSLSTTPTRPARSGARRSGTSGSCSARRSRRRSSPAACDSSPAQPSFLDARNAILQADTAQFGGVHLNTLWGVFANRGMGFGASTAGPDDAAPHRTSPAASAGRDDRPGRRRRRPRRRRDPAGGARERRRPRPGRVEADGPGRPLDRSAAGRASRSAARPPAAPPRR